MKRVLRSEEMRAYDAFTIREIKVPSAVLMERAALCVAEKVLELLPGEVGSAPVGSGASDSGQLIGFDSSGSVLTGCGPSGSVLTGSVLILAGSGNNGGDGYACARILSLKGIPSSVLETGEEGRFSEETAKQREICKRLAVPIFPLNTIEEQELSSLLERAAILVDALLGTGLKRDVGGALAQLIGKVNACGTPVVAVDLPSGISADTGAVLGCAVKAAATVTMQYLKPGLLLYPGASFAGEVSIAEIGIADPTKMVPMQTQIAEANETDSMQTQIAEANETDSMQTRIADANDTGTAESTALDPVLTLTPIYMLEKEELPSLLPPRRPDGNKGSFGKVLAVTGAKNMAGAAMLCSEAALRSGCGMVRILTVEENRIILQGAVPEAILTTVDADDPSAWLDALRPAYDWCDVVLMGPGIGTGEPQRIFLKELLAVCEKPLVLDADALNLLSRDTELLKSRNPKAEVFVTPHMMEMSRLTGKTVPELKADPIQSAEEFSNSFGLTCVLKDARTVIAAPGPRLFINSSGNSGMGTAGSGDVLSGILASLLAQGIPPECAAQTAVLLHGLAGDAAKEAHGERYMTAGNIIAGLDALHL